MKHTAVDERLVVKLSLVTTLLNDLGLSWLGFEHPPFRMRGDCASAAAKYGDEKK